MSSPTIFIPKSLAPPPILSSRTLLQQYRQELAEEGNVFSYDANADGNMNERGDNSSPRASVWRNEDEFVWGNDESSLGP